MGHYDDCYDFDRDKASKAAENYLQSKIKQLDREEISLVTKVIVNIDDFKGFVNFLKVLKK